jgi:hypothetical protein
MPALLYYLTMSDELIFYKKANMSKLTPMKILIYSLFIFSLTQTTSKLRADGPPNGGDMIKLEMLFLKK